MSGLFLLRPLWLLALLPIAAAAIYLMRRRQAGDWSPLVDPPLLQALHRMGRISDGGRNLYAWLPLASASLLVLALSGPAVPKAGETEFRALDPLVLVLDLSPSIVAEDRVLADLQAGASYLLDGAAGRPVGLMVYAADAYLASAPTTDIDGIRSLIGVLRQDTLPVAGSRPDIALSMARDLFGGSEGLVGGADLVLITDGAGAGLRAEEEAARLANDGARVWALMLPAATGAPPPNETGLAALTKAGKGVALPVAEATTLAERIARARTAKLAREEGLGQGVREFGLWLVPLALLALFPLFRRRR